MSTRRTVNGALLGVPEAAAYLGGSERWLRRLVAKAKVPARKLDGQIVFKRTELEDFVAGLKGISVRQALCNVQKRTAASG